MSALQIMQIDPVSIVITDVERSRHFYRDLLGLKEIAVEMPASGRRR